MVALDALALALVLSAAGETVLLDFSASWCGPCQMVEPAVRRLVAEGYPIRRVDIDQNPQLASRYRVTSVPCFVMVVGGREVDRVVGATSPDRLRQMFARARFEPRKRPGDPRPSAAGTPPTARSSAPPSRPTATTGDDRQSFPCAAPARGTSEAGSRQTFVNAAQRALAATVRIKVDDPDGQSVGTGTIVDRVGAEALVLTCGHLFRDSSGKGAIHVELFAGGTPRAVRGQLISYDLQRDVAFISIAPGMPIDPVKVAPAGYSITRGGPVFSVGCDHGRRPSVVESRITAIDKYLGPPNVEVAGQPVDGRSGGGLFSSEGYLIGVCNAADPADGEGIYAALPAIHWGLDNIGQRRIYQTQPPEPQLIASHDSQGEPPPDDPLPPPMPPQMPDSPLAAQEPPLGRLVSLESNAMRDDTEVICIVRSRGRPEGQEQLYILTQPSTEFLQRLIRESRPAARPDAEITLQPVREARGPAVWPRRSTTGGTIRAQSADP
jgi:thiol-disulfide isomerase/thioredoxin